MGRQAVQCGLNNFSKRDALLAVLEEKKGKEHVRRK